MAIVPGLWPGSAHLMVLEARQCPSRSPDGFRVDSSHFWKAHPYPLVIFYADIGVFCCVFLPELPLDTGLRGGGAVLLRLLCQGAQGSGPRPLRVCCQA